jgi:hypothetical protein
LKQSSADPCIYNCEGNESGQCTDKGCTTTVWGNSAFIPILCWIQLADPIGVHFGNGLSGVAPCDYFGTDATITHDQNGNPLSATMDCHSLVGLIVDTYGYFAHGGNVSVSNIQFEITAVGY